MTNSQSAGLSKDDVLTLFSNVEMLFNLHKKFLDGIRERVMNWGSVSHIGDLFLAATWIKLYKHYASNQPTAVKALKEIREKNAKFREYLKAREFAPVMMMMGLDTLVQQPIQRVPRCELFLIFGLSFFLRRTFPPQPDIELLQEELKVTPTEHPDHGQLEEAIGMIRGLSEGIDQSKQLGVNMEKLVGIKAQIDGLPFELAVAKRQFIKDGVVLVGKDKRHAWLFTDIFVFTTEEKKGKNKFKQFVELEVSRPRSTAPPLFTLPLSCRRLPSNRTLRTR